MKKWEEERKKKAHDDRIKQARSKVGSSQNPKKFVSKGGTPSMGSTAYQKTSTSVSSRLSNPVFKSYKEEAEDKMAPEETPIFKLLKAFKLQQYARKMIDRGFGHEVSKLALLQFTQRQELVT